MREMITQNHFVLINELLCNSQITLQCTAKEPTNRDVSAACLSHYSLDKAPVILNTAHVLFCK